MKKDIFTVWLKEFCSLVFTQAVQAFLLAAVMSVIVATASGNLDINKGSAASATGVIAIIALSAISKIETLVKKVFGIESQFGDPSMKSGMVGLAGTLIGAKLAGRVLNNVGKVGGGIVDYGRQARNRARLNRDYARNLAALNASRPTTVVATGPVTSSGGSSSSNNNNSRNGNNGSSASANNNNNSGNGNVNSNNNSGGNSNNAGNSNTNASQVSALTGATVTLSPNTVNVNGSNVSVDGKQTAADKQADFERKKADLLEKYNDAIEGLDDKRSAAIAKIASGFTESVGGIVGGVAGATVGLATGDGILSKTGAGMGIGDIVGEKTVQTVQTSYDIKVTEDRKNREERKATKAVNDLTGKDISNYRTAIKDLEKYASRLGDITDDAAKKTDAGNI